MDKLEKPPSPREATLGGVQFGERNSKPASKISLYT